MMRALGIRSTPLLAAILAAACGLTPGAEPEPEPERVVGWQVGAREHIGLWYHGLATVLTPEGDDEVLPRYDPAYRDSIVAIKRRMGVYPTPLDQRAAEFGRTFEESYEGLEFVPLYFGSTEALFSAIEIWEQSRGDPRRAGSAQAARIVQFFSSLFPRPAQRAAVTEWARLLREEHQIFYQAYWQDRQPMLQARIQAVQAEWDELAPALRDYLDYIQLENGHLFLVPALSVEGRLVTQGLRVPRAAVLEPPANRPELAALGFVHEIVYPVAREAVRDYLAPARIRELGEERVLALAAVRGGAMLLQEVAPQRVEAYQSLYLDAAGRPPAANGADDLDAAFRRAFPLPNGLEEGLRTAIERALAGI